MFKIRCLVETTSIARIGHSNFLTADKVQNFMSEKLPVPKSSEHQDIRIFIIFSYTGLACLVSGLEKSKLDSCSRFFTTLFKVYSCC